MSLLERVGSGHMQVRQQGRDASQGDPARIMDETEIDADLAANSDSAGQMTKAIAFAKSKGASIIGLTGTGQSVGVSTISQHLAQSYASFGKRTLLVDVSKVSDLPSEASSGAQANAGLADYATLISGNVGVVDLLGIPSGPPNEQALRAMFAVAVEQGLTIIVDLPPIVRADGRPSPAFATVGALCDIAFVICPTGGVSASELKACHATSDVAGVNIAGIILNDWHLPLHSLLPA